MKNKATKQDYEYFKRKCKDWMEVLSLQSWKIFYDFKPLKSNMADCSTDYDGRVGTIRLNNGKVNVEVTRHLLNEVALHECLELLLQPMHDLARCRSWDKYEWDKERHSVIRILEKLLMSMDEEV